MPEMPLVIVGASVRAAAQCARRAGFAPWGADLFGDEDLRAVAEVQVVPAADYPSGIPSLIENWAPAGAPLMYTGAMENHPEALAELAKERPLWGCAPRDERQPPERIGLRTPMMTRKPAGLPADGSWLLKPLRSGGGRGIRPYFGEPLTGAEQASCGFQQRVEGEALSGVFLADAEQTVLVGLSRQLVGETWLHAKPFSYCGSIGPLSGEEFIAAGALQALERHARLGFRGLFGADFIRDAAGLFWLIEINPRFTASVELYELALGEPLLRWHARCFTEPAPLREWESRLHLPERTVAKAIWFLPPGFPTGLAFPKLKRCERQWRELDGWAVPDLADLPAPGTPLVAGQPLLTLFVEEPAADPCMLERKLREKVAAFAAELRKELALDEE